MSLLKEFKTFAMRGPVIDLAVGVVIGAAFSKIVTSLVNEIIMPPIGLLTGGVDFSQLKWVIKPAIAGNKATEVAIQYGAFINTIIQFLIIAVAIFFMIKLINTMVHKKEATPTPNEVALLTEIRDLLKQRQL